VSQAAQRSTSSWKHGGHGHWAKALLATMVKKDEERAECLATWIGENIPEGLTVFSFPIAHRRRIRTANSPEQLNREVRRRSRVAVLFPNVASCERLVTAVLMQISEEWEASRTYMRSDAEEVPF
jgi:transposase-like protein